ncbi:MAG TPA: hypothetical protein VFO16_08685 [Pseudonocardiaceae bacterium]|nr:hypothetical protein [Pseudonocardiaceae bacterium]
MRASAAVAPAVVGLAAGIIGLAGPQAAASPAAAQPVLRHITGTAGNSGQLVCGVNTRTKNETGNIDMVLNQAPAGQLMARLQNAKTGMFFGEEKLLTTGMMTTTLANNILAGTQFHVCTASPSGSLGGPYSADLTY